MTIEKYFRYDTFNPSTNTFDSKHRGFAKEVDKATGRKLKLTNNLRSFCICIMLPFLISSLVFGCISEAGECFWWAILACVGCIIAFAACIFGCLALEEHEGEIENNFRNNAFEEEKAECEAYNAEQEAIAEEWRKAHPFEEKIRMAQTRGSSVDIAEMVRHYAEYINNGSKQKDETLD